jgi:hypothetical protein
MREDSDAMCVFFALVWFGTSSALVGLKKKDGTVLSFLLPASQIFPSQAS